MDCSRKIIGLLFLLLSVIILAGCLNLELQKAITACTKDYNLCSKKCRKGETSAVLRCTQRCQDDIYSPCLERAGVTL